MKYLILLLLISSTSFADISDRETQHITEVQIQRFTTALENENYDFLEQLFNTNQLFPFLIVQNSKIVQNEITNQITFQNSGNVIAYTNIYGIVFLESSQTALNISEITKLPYHEEGMLDMYTDLQNISSNNIEQFNTLFYRGIHIALQYPLASHTPTSVINSLTNVNIALTRHIMLAHPSYRYNNDFYPNMISTLLYPFMAKHPTLGSKLLEKIEDTNNSKVRDIFFKKIFHTKSIQISLQNYLIYASFYNKSFDNFIRPIKYWDTTYYNY